MVFEIEAHLVPDFVACLGVCMCVLYICVCVCIPPPPTTTCYSQYFVADLIISIGLLLVQQDVL